MLLLATFSLLTNDELFNPDKRPELTKREAEKREEEVEGKREPSRAKAMTGSCGVNLPGTPLVATSARQKKQNLAGRGGPTLIKLLYTKVPTTVMDPNRGD